MAGVARTADGLRSCPGFGPFWAAATVSSFGTYVTTLAVQVLVVLTLGGGAAEVGLVSAGRRLPYLLSVCSQACSSIGPVVGRYW